MSEVPRYAIGADVGATNVKLAAVTMDGNVLEQRHFATHDGAGEVETPLHPARAGLRAPLGSLHQTEKLEQLLRASSRRGARDPVPAAPQLARRRGLSREAISWIADPRHKLRARRDSSQAPRCPLIGRPRTYHGGAWRATAIGAS